MPGNATVVRIMEKLRDHVPDAYSMAFYDQLQTAMNLMPMRMVLDKVHGESVVVKSKIVGVSRNTWYGWLRGEIRPNKHQAERLHRITGIPAEKFQGRR